MSKKDRHLYETLGLADLVHAEEAENAKVDDRVEEDDRSENDEPFGDPRHSRTLVKTSNALVHHEQRNLLRNSRNHGD